MTQSLIWIALSLTEKMGMKTLKRIYDYNPDFKFPDLFSDDKLKQVINNKRLVERLSDKSYFSNKLREAEHLVTLHEQAGIKVVSIDSEYYPKLLKTIENPPSIFYCKGNMELLKEENVIAIIGTREPTEYGRVAAKKIARVFAEKGYIIVSGLALGIDAAGHRGALEVPNGKTIAVLAGSLDKIYPKENNSLANKILVNNGLILSEIPLGKPTFRGSFVMRDRIQSGLSLGVCPVQATLNSGTHHTIGFANEHNRVLFCPIPLEPKTVEATQGIYELMRNGSIQIIKTIDDYMGIEKLLQLKKDEILKWNKTSKVEKVDLEYNLFDLFDQDDL